MQKKEERPSPADAVRTEMNAFAHDNILHTFAQFVKSFSVEKRIVVQGEIMQIAKSGVDKRGRPGYNAIHEGKGVFECRHSEALFLS